MSDATTARPRKPRIIAAWFTTASRQRAAYRWSIDGGNAPIMDSQPFTPNDVIRVMPPRSITTVPDNSPANGSPVKPSASFPWKRMRVMPRTLSASADQPAPSTRWDPLVPSPAGAGTGSSSWPPGLIRLVNTLDSASFSKEPAFTSVPSSLSRRLGTGVCRVGMPGPESSNSSSMKSASAAWLSTNPWVCAYCSTCTCMARALANRGPRLSDMARRMTASTSAGRSGRTSRGRFARPWTMACMVANSLVQSYGRPPVAIS